MASSLLPFIIITLIKLVSCYLPEKEKKKDSVSVKFLLRL